MATFYQVLKIPEKLKFYYLYKCDKLDSTKIVILSIIIFRQVNTDHL